VLKLPQWVTFDLQFGKEKVFVILVGKRNISGCYFFLFSNVDVNLRKLYIESV